jgi:hypothetical protein
MIIMISEARKKPEFARISQNKRSQEKLKKPEENREESVEGREGHFGN